MAAAVGTEGGVVSCVNTYAVNAINLSRPLGACLAATRMPSLVCCVVPSYPVSVLSDDGHHLAELLAHVQLVGVENDENQV